MLYGKNARQGEISMPSETRKTGPNSPPSSAGAPAILLQTASQPDNPTVEENRRPGTTAWQLQYYRCDDPVTMASTPLNRRLRSSTVEGFVSKTSVLPGETLDFKVSLNPPGRCRIDLYRMGYYGGTG